ncbi:hypothetical protein [Falsiporphyromonas endometrii]|uniref:Uncharacterized protein n=1 Tax=Falsiporphyromonas endometrii TaxID=1387297 RepID=A0ABV9K868_9PORP
MEISILLTILLIVILLGGLFLQGGKVFLMSEEEMDLFSMIKYNLISGLHDRAVKLVRRDSYMLNTVILIDAQKAAQSTIIQLQNHNFRG